MSAVHRSHLDEDTVESYAFGRLSEEEISFVEEHLLWCESCRQQVEKTDDFIRTFKLADARVRAAEVARPSSWVKRLFRLRPLHLSAGLATGCLAVLLLRPSPPSEFQARLVATRGAFDSVRTVAAGARLELALDLRGLPPAPSMLAELASGDGAILWTSKVQTAGEEVSVRPGVTLEPGVYWLRLHSADSGRTLLREFGIRAR